MNGKGVLVSRQLGSRILALAVVLLVGGIASPRVGYAGKVARAHRSSEVARVRAIYHGLSVRPPHKRSGKGKVKQRLYNAYMLHTAGGQKASVSFRDGTLLYMNQRTDAVLRSPSLTYVKHGQVSQILVPGTNHRVQTDAAIGAAIGTEFAVNVSGSTTFFVVVEGALRVYNQYGVVILTQGEASFVHKGQKPGTPYHVNAVGLTAWMNQLPPPDHPLGENVGLATAGAHIAGFSSENAGTGTKSWAASQINDGSLESGWSSGPGQLSDQWVNVSFAHDATLTISGVVIDPAATEGHPASDDLKGFEIRVSTSGLAPADFKTVFTATTKQSAQLQRFVFPKPALAKYVQLHALGNYGGQDGIDVAELEIVGNPSSTGTPGPTPPPTPGGSTCPPSQAACIQVIFRLLNDDRKRYHEPLLHLSATQSVGTGSCVGAYGHSRAMAQTGTLWHVDPKFSKASFPHDICISYRHSANENVGWFSSGNELEDLQHLNVLMIGEPHDAATCRRQLNHACTILDPVFTTVGIGIYYTKNKTWLTEDFVG